MKINLTGVGKNTTSNSTLRTMHGLNDSPSKAKPLDQNSKILFSNSLYYKSVLEEVEDGKGIPRGTHREELEKRVNLPVNSSTHLNLRVNIPSHRTNVVIQKHKVPAPPSAAYPFALNACDNAQIEEQRAKDREIDKKHQAEVFHHNTRLHLLSKMQDIQREKDQANYETAEKIKKLLAETIEFSQKTAMASKRGGSITAENSPRGSSTGRGDAGVIRNLVGSPDEKASRIGGSGSKTTGGPQFLNVVEQQEEEAESSTGEIDINIHSADAQKALNDLKRARGRIHKKSQTLQEMLRQQQLMQAALAAQAVDEKASPKRKVGLKKDANKGGAPGSAANRGGGSTSTVDRDVEAFKNIVKDYNRQLNNQNPRDFNADLPILQALGAESYDKINNIDYLQLQLENALKKFVKDWKTIDTTKINYLMKYGIVQEVMKIEERKGVRLQAANRPQKGERDTTPSPRSAAKQNSDIKGVANYSEAKRRWAATQPKKFLDAPEHEPKNRGRARFGGLQGDSEKSIRHMTPNNSSPNIKQGGTSSVSGFGGSEHPQKKKINFGDSAENSQVFSNKRPKDAPTIGNPLMMKMEFQSQREKKGPAGQRSQSGAETLSKFSRSKQSKSGRSGKSRSSYRSGSRRSGSRYEEEEDYEEMPIEELDVALDQVYLNLNKEQLRFNAWVHENEKDKKDKQFKKKKLKKIQELDKLREKIALIERIKDQKTPFYEKLPKDSAFYKHYMCILQQNRLEETTSKKVVEDRAVLINAAASIPVPQITSKVLRP